MVVAIEVVELIRLQDSSIAVSSIDLFSNIDRKKLGNAATNCYRMRRWSNLSTGHPVLVSGSQRLPTSEVHAGVKSKQPGDLLQGYQEE